MHATVIVLLNQKGGVGKTSVCNNLAGGLAERGKKVLLVDNDPQSSLSQGLWGPERVEMMPPEGTIYGLYAGIAPGFADAVIYATDLAGIDLVPGCQLAERFNVPESWDAPREHQVVLRDLVDANRNAYDFVLIDCPPNLHLCSWAALVAADHIIIPLQAEDYGAQGLKHINRSIALVQGGANPSLKKLGILVTMFEPRKGIHQGYIKMLRDVFAEEVFETTVPRAVDFPEAIARRTHVLRYKPRGAAARAIRDLVDEVLRRIDAPAAPVEEAA